MIQYVWQLHPSRSICHVKFFVFIQWILTYHLNLVGSLWDQNSCWSFSPPTSVDPEPVRTTAGSFFRPQGNDSSLHWCVTGHCGFSLPLGITHSSVQLDSDRFSKVHSQMQRPGRRIALVCSCTGWSITKLERHKVKQSSRKWNKISPDLFI